MAAGRAVHAHAVQYWRRIISTLLGLLLVLMGAAWILLAYNIAFNGPPGAGGERRFMVEDRSWAVYGAIAIVVGLLQIAWSNTRKARGRRVGSAGPLLPISDFPHFRIEFHVVRFGG